MVQTKVINNASDCEGYNLLNSTRCTSMRWEFGNSSCVPESYVGNVCKMYLTTWQNCILGSTDSSIPVITTLPDQDEAERFAVDVLNVIGIYALCFYH